MYTNYTGTLWELVHFSCLGEMKRGEVTQQGREKSRDKRKCPRVVFILEGSGAVASPVPLLSLPGLRGAWYQQRMLDVKLTGQAVRNGCEPAVKFQNF